MPKLSQPEERLWLESEAQTWRKPGSCTNLTDQERACGQVGHEMAPGILEVVYDRSSFSEKSKLT